MFNSSVLSRTIYGLAGCLGSVAACQAAALYAVRSDGERAVSRIIARDVCAWPAMTRLDDGTILIANFNQPSHGRMVGDVDTWASVDDGKSWEKRAPGAPHLAGTLSNRMNVAFGALPGGEVLLVASGWSLKTDASTPSGLQIDKILRPWVSRSLDGGRTWLIDRESFPEFSPGGGHQIPFGPVQMGASGDLLVPVYDNIPNPQSGKTKWTHVYVYRSRDRGKSWVDPVVIDAESSYNETALLHVGGGRWLAFCRTTHLVAYESSDDGRTWAKLGPATDKSCYPANAIRLRDGRILLCYGNRAAGDPRVEAKISSDRGKTWSAPARVAEVLAAPKPGLEDMGYPSSVQLADGSLLTAYYAKRSRLYDGYHLAVVQWDAARTFDVALP